MASGESQEETLVRGFADEEFVADLLALIERLGARHRGKMDSTPKKGAISEHSLTLLVSNGACLALNELKIEIERLHKVALERPQ